MAKGRMGPEKVRSCQMATLIALLANVHRDPKKHRAYRPEDFDPYATRPRKPSSFKVTRENWDRFINAFVGGT